MELKNRWIAALKRYWEPEGVATRHTALTGAVVEIGKLKAGQVALVL